MSSEYILDLKYHGVAVVRNALLNPAPLVGAWREMSERPTWTEAGQRDDRFFTGELHPVLGRLFHAAPLVRIATEILGVDDVAVYMNRLLIKDEHWNGPVHCHQDLPYFHGHNKLSMFIPLAPASAANGSLVFVKGSHRFGPIGRGTVNLNLFPSLEHYCPSIVPGDVVLMDFLTWHYSGPMLTARPQDPRPILQIVYQPATDGSYGAPGIKAPTLVSGNWKTEHFTPWKCTEV